MQSHEHNPPESPESELCLASRSSRNSGCAFRALPLLTCVTPASERALPVLEVIEVTICGSRTCKPNSVRRIAPAGRPFLWAAHCCAALATYPKVGRAEPVRVRSPDSKNQSRKLPPYLVLLRVGFALPAALLLRRCALTAPFHPYPGVSAEAVCFLWHFPSSGLESALPDVIRHTALRSSDFPLPAPEDAESDRPVRLPTE